MGHGPHAAVGAQGQQHAALVKRADVVKDGRAQAFKPGREGRAHEALAAFRCADLLGRQQRLE